MRSRKYNKNKQNIIMYNIVLLLYINLNKVTFIFYNTVFQY